MLEILRALVVLRLEIILDAERGIALEHLGYVLARRRLVAELGMAGGEEGVMQMVGRRDAGKGRDRLGIMARHEMRAAEMVPEPLRMIRVEAHRLLDPRNAFFRAPEPGQHLALLHHDEIVVGVERKGALL